MSGAVVLSIVCILSAFILWHIADKRGANTLIWAIMGAVFGPLAIPFIFLTKKKSYGIVPRSKAPNPRGASRCTAAKQIESVFRKRSISCWFSTCFTKCRIKQNFSMRSDRC